MVAEMPTIQVVRSVDDVEIDANHWTEWRSAVARLGYSDKLQLAAERLQVLDTMSVEDVEALFRAEQIITSGEYEPLRFSHHGEPVVMSPFAVFGCDFLAFPPQ